MMAAKRPHPHQAQPNDGIPPTPSKDVQWVCSAPGRDFSIIVKARSWFAARAKARIKFQSDEVVVVQRGAK